MTAASTGPLLFLSTWGGWVADRHPKRTVLVSALVVPMVLSLLLAFLTWTGLIQPWQIIAISALRGIVMAFEMPARQSFVIKMTSREDLRNAIALNSSMINGARIIGSAIAGVVMAKFGVALCYFMDGVSFIAVILGLLAMRLPKHIRKEHTGSKPDLRRHDAPRQPRLRRPRPHGRRPHDHHHQRRSHLHPRRRRAPLRRPAPRPHRRLPLSEPHASRLRDRLVEMIRAIFDTNVILASQLSNRGAAFEILQRLRRGEWRLVLSNHLLLE